MSTRATGVPAARTMMALAAVVAAVFGVSMRKRSVAEKAADWL